MKNIMAGSGGGSNCTATASCDAAINSISCTGVGVAGVDCQSIEGTSISIVNCKNADGTWSNQSCKRG
jgi:hypothetical protein